MSSTKAQLNAYPMKLESALQLAQHQLLNMVLFVAWPQVKILSALRFTVSRLLHKVSFNKLRSDVLNYKVGIYTYLKVKDI